MPRRSLLAHLGVWLWIGWMAFYFFLTLALGPLLVLAACHTSSSNASEIDSAGWCSTLLYPLAATLRFVGGAGLSATVIGWLTWAARWTLVVVFVPMTVSALAPVGRHRQPKWLLKFGSWIVR